MTEQINEIPVHELNEDGTYKLHKNIDGITLTELIRHIELLRNFFGENAVLIPRWDKKRIDIYVNDSEH